MASERAVPRTPLLEMRGISKRFGELQALDKVDLVVNEGEIHALVGENGAGKTTLMNILYGLYHPDAGTISIRGKDAHITGPRDAIALGIGMIHQHFMLVPPLTVGREHLDEANLFASQSILDFVGAIQIISPEFRNHDVIGSVG